MIVNKVPTLQQFRITLSECRRIATESVAREEWLIREVTRLRTVAAKTAEKIIAQAESFAEQRRLAVAAAHQEQLRRMEAQREARRERIQKAHVHSRRRVTQLLDQQNGRAVFGFQKGTLDAERLHKTNLETAAQTHAETSELIAQSTARLQSREAELLADWGAFRLFRRWLSGTHPWPAPNTSADEHDLIRRAESAFTSIDSDSKRSGAHLLANLFRFLPIWGAVIFLGLVGAGAIWGLPLLQRPSMDRQTVMVAMFSTLSALIALRFLVQQQLRSRVERMALHLANARGWLASAAEKASARYQSDVANAEHTFTATTQDIRHRWRQHEMDDAAARSLAVDTLSRKAVRAHATHERLSKLRRERLDHSQQAEKECVEREIAENQTGVAERISTDRDRMEREISEQWVLLIADWNTGLAPHIAFLQHCLEARHLAFPDWNSEDWKDWEPGKTLGVPITLGQIHVDVRLLAQAWPQDPRLAFPLPPRLTLPLWLSQPDESSVTLETEKGGTAEAGASLNHLALQLLCSMPPGRLKVTILDPVGLGKSYSSLMHLADYADVRSGASQRIWTESSEIEERLAELTTHIEKILQMYLRNEFATLAEYNAAAGSIAEPYHLLIVSGFPIHFSETSARRLHNLITNGGRCGILTLLHWDRRHPVPAGFTSDDLSRAGVHLVRAAEEFTAVPPLGPGIRISLQSPPDQELATSLLRSIGKAGRDANKVEVPFDVIAPSEDQLWLESTVDEIHIAIGRTGASKLQTLALGRGTRQHALISGKTGSGKSNLLHVIITHLALRFSPAEIEFYLVDFKKGVEFKSYATAQLPHARVVAIESDREFGLSVLERLDSELRRRGERFRELGVQNLPGYRSAGGLEPMPRCLLLVDEFQEYFVQEDRVSQTAALLLDRIVRQGRAFGIHVILASQTLGGTYALARATLGQMAVRIAFHCDEADAYLIMGDENPAPRLLSRPGEGIYNDAAGAVEANSPFQAVWLPDEVRERYLEILKRRSSHSPWSQQTPVVFEGSAPARIDENTKLSACLDRVIVHPPAIPTGWIGAPNSIKGPTEVAFSRSGGSNLLVVGQSEETTLSIVACAVLTLAAQFPAGTVRFVIIDTTQPATGRSQFMEQLAAAIPHPVEMVPAGRAPEALIPLAQELSRRTTEGTRDPMSIFLVIIGLQHCKKLKPDDSFSFSSEPVDPAANGSAVFQSLYVDGPSAGIHCLVQVDSYNNVNRFLGRKGLTEFEQRVLLQMSATDSSSLAEQPSASQLGLYGALLYNDREGTLETFRPYSLPEAFWLTELGHKLARSKAASHSPSASVANMMG